MSTQKQISSGKISIPARANAPATQLFVKIITANRESFGSRPVIFILPGGPGADHSHYLKYSCLIDQGDIVFHDPRGCGKSDKADYHTYTMENYIDDIEAIRQSLGLTQIIILGKSYGSDCALGYALRYPQAVKKLILSAGAPSFRFIETAKENLIRRGTLEQINICKKLWSGNFKNRDELVEYFQIMEPLYSTYSAPTQKSNWQKKLRNFSFEACNLGFSTFLRTFDYESQLPKITCPTLILAGDQDWISDAKYGQLMANHIPHSLLKIFANAGHALETDVPEAYFQAIKDFLNPVIFS